MNQAENPLDKLRDIHLPDQIDTFQLAPGWWFVLFLIFCSIIYLLYKTFQKRKALAMLKPLAEEISSLRAQTASADSIAKLSELYKRVILMYYPTKQVASLSGNQWLKFINNQNSDLRLSEKQTIILSSFAYQKSPDISSEDWQGLVSQSHQILTAIITEKSLNNLRGEV